MACRALSCSLQSQSQFPSEIPQCWGRLSCPTVVFYQHGNIVFMAPSLPIIHAPPLPDLCQTNRDIVDMLVSVLITQQKLQDFIPDCLNLEKRMLKINSCMGYCSILPHLRLFIHDLVYFNTISRGHQKATNYVIIDPLRNWNNKKSFSSQSALMEYLVRFMLYLKPVLWIFSRGLILRWFVGA